MAAPWNEYRDRIEGALQALLDEREQQDPLYQPIQHMLSIGGKRLRPIALLLACDMYGGDEERAICAGTGIELFHNFTLMHDDLMDEAPLRRGKPTVHERFGENMAVLAGDAMFVKAYQEMAKVDPEALQAVLEDFNRVALEVCEGQRLDMDFEEREEVGIDEYLRMVVSKTGALLGGALAIGARIGGASEEEVKGMEETGRNAGVAFQLQDDLLDVFGDEGKFGKQKGGDILAGKKTFLLIRAQKKSNPEQRKRLRKALNDADDEERVRKVTHLYQELGIEEETRSRSQAYFEEALKGLERTQVEDVRKDPLHSLIEGLKVREA